MFQDLTNIFLDLLFKAANFYKKLRKQFNYIYRKYCLLLLPQKVWQAPLITILLFLFYPIIIIIYQLMPNCFLFLFFFAVLLILNVIKKQVIDNESNISHPEYKKKYVECV